MKKIKLIPFVIITCFYLNTSNAQTTNDISGEWQFGLGLNVIKDNGKKGEVKSLNFGNPFILSAEYAFSNQFSLNAGLSFNKYKEGQAVDGLVVAEGDSASYMAFDLSLKFYFRELWDTNNFEPYVLAGFGYTTIGSYEALNEGKNIIRQFPRVGRMTMNVGLGTNYRFSESWGMNLNVMAKFGAKSGENKDFISNQGQISLGVFYSFLKKDWRS